MIGEEEGNDRSGRRRWTSALRDIFSQGQPWVFMGILSFRKSGFVSERKKYRRNDEKREKKNLSFVLQCNGEKKSRIHKSGAKFKNYYTHYNEYYTCSLCNIYVFRTGVRKSVSNLIPKLCRYYIFPDRSRKWPKMRFSCKT